MNAPAADARQPRYRRRWLLILLAVLLIAVLVGSALLAWWLQPQRATRMLLSQLGPALGLELSAEGPNEYRLRGTPQLVVRGVRVQRPGSGAQLLEADRVSIAVPWSTIRSRGAVLDIERIELDKPRLQLAQLQAWLATRPPGDGPLPRFSKGIAVTDGEIVGEGWRMIRLGLEVPDLQPQQPVRAQLHGQYVAASIRTGFDLAIALTRPDIDTGVGIVGRIMHDQGSWQLPALLTVSAALRGHDGSVGAYPLRASISGHLHTGDTTLPLAAALNTHACYTGERLQLERSGIALRGGVSGSDPATQLLPDMDAHGTLDWGKQLALRLQGRLAAWPQAWPALPAPIGTSSSALPFLLEYSGGTDLAEAARVELRRDAAVFDARLRLPQLLAWTESAGVGSPLPPLAGKLVAPRIDISGAHLHGLHIHFDDPDLEPDAAKRPLPQDGSATKSPAP